MEKQDILDYVSKTPENVNVNVLGGMLDELASGGGGSSDFSYINVTFINSATDNSTYSVKSVQTDDEYGVFFDMIATIGNTEQTIPLLAYKGRVVLFADNFESIDYENVAPVVMGDVVFDEDQWSFTITGECSITLKSRGIM